MSRQLTQQRELRKQGLCISCGKPASRSTRSNNFNHISQYCEDHKIKYRTYGREYMRKRNNNKTNANNP